MFQEREHDFYEFVLMGSGQRSKSGFRVQMFQNRKWMEDKEVPDNLLNFRSEVRFC
jgi:hypothetical protein